MEKTRQEIKDEIIRLGEQEKLLSGELNTWHNAIQNAIHNKNKITIQISNTRKEINRLEAILGGVKQKTYDIEFYKEDLRKKFIENKKHFTKRLKERYNIKLKKGEYEELCVKKIKKSFYKLNSHKSFGVLEIYGKDVWVIKDKDVKSLVTCLTPESNRLPVPRTLSRVGVTQEDFIERYHQCLERARKVFDWLFVNNDDKEKLFKENPLDEDDHILKLGCRLRYNKGTHILTQYFIDSMFKTEEEEQK